jgi:low affinity Fe/Cu permease
MSAEGRHNPAVAKGRSPGEPTGTLLDSSDLARNAPGQSTHENETADIFRRFSRTVSVMVGSSWAFVAAAAIIIAWAISGPIFGFSDTWQLVINTGTTIVTFLMVFLIQNTQNRDARAMHLKLDELIHAVETASNRIIDAEEASDSFLESKAKEFRALAGR